MLNFWPFNRKRKPLHQTIDWTACNTGAPLKSTQMDAVRKLVATPGAVRRFNEATPAEIQEKLKQHAMRKAAGGQLQGGAIGSKGSTQPNMRVAPLVYPDTSERVVYVDNSPSLIDVAMTAELISSLEQPSASQFQGFGGGDSGGGGASSDWTASDTPSSGSSDSYSSSSDSSSSCDSGSSSSDCGSSGGGDS